MVERAELRRVHAELGLLEFFQLQQALGKETEAAKCP